MTLATRGRTCPYLEGNLVDLGPPRLRPPLFLLGPPAFLPVSLLHGTLGAEQPIHGGSELGHSRSLNVSKGHAGKHVCVEEVQLYKLGSKAETQGGGVKRGSGDGSQFNIVVGYGLEKPALIIWLCVRGAQPTTWSPSYIIFRKVGGK